MRSEAPFLSWCSSQGITSPLELKGVGSAYRYLASPTDLPARTDIVTVPLDACIIDDTKEGLAERLSHERSLGSRSEFAPFVDTMPDVDELSADFPRFWTAERRDSLFGYDGGQLERRVAADERDGLDPWAWTCVSSRCNFLDDLRYSLTPMLDFLNHDASVGTSAGISDRNELSLAIDRPAKAGEEVFISYGALSNIDTLCDYGFVAPDNPCNTEMVEIRMLGLPPTVVPVYPSGSIDDGAIATLRRHLATPEEIDIEQDQRGDRGALLSFAKPVTDRLELDVFSLIASSLDDSASTARVGGEETEAAGDKLAAEYLSARSATLQKGIAWVLKKFPDLEY